jgi:hypothetical protein
MIALSGMVDAGASCDQTSYRNLFGPHGLPETALNRTDPVRKLNNRPSGLGRTFVVPIYGLLLVPGKEP